MLYKCTYARDYLPFSVILISWMKTASIILVLFSVTEKKSMHFLYFFANAAGWKLRVLHVTEKYLRVLVYITEQNLRELENEWILRYLASVTERNPRVSASTVERNLRV